MRLRLEVKPARRPGRRCSTFCAASTPSGTESSRRLGSCASFAFSGDAASTRLLARARSHWQRSRRRARRSAGAAPPPPRLYPPLSRSPLKGDSSPLWRVRRRPMPSGTLRRRAEVRRPPTDRVRDEPVRDARVPGSRRITAISSMEKRAIMRSANAVLPEVGFAPETLLAPRQALVAYFSRVATAPPGTERVALDDASGRVLAQAVTVDGDYPRARGSTMDGFALRSPTHRANSPLWVRSLWAASGRAARATVGRSHRNRRRRAGERRRRPTN